ncbi:MAG: ABC transporter ATP-binding protein [Candidatus Aceula meridiana]|nr:ABC transporter ATP-binding protein [Candidatus Aceula meridiana]
MLIAVGIHKIYRDVGKPLEVLKGIDLTIEVGDFLAMVGPSGAGKSTLMHVLGGLDRPSKGSVALDGEDIYRLSDVKLSSVRNTKVGFVFQFYHLLPEFTALENVVMPGLVRDSLRNKKQLEEKGEALLLKVGLSSRLAHKPSQLSGGEQQRVAIARALMNDPKVILCDEPTGNLDSQSGESIIELLMKLNQENNQTVVMVTHDNMIAQKAKRIIYIQDGKLIQKEGEQ